MTSNTRERTAPSRWYRANLWIHRWVSLVVAFPFAVLCLTGVILIFHHEVDELLGQAPRLPHDQSSQAQPLADSIRAAEQAYPDERVVSATLDDEHFPGLLLMGLLAEGGRFDSARWLYADINRATLVEQPAFDETFSGFLLELHAQWFLGPLGELLGAFIALLVLLSLLSGVVVYAPYVRKFLFGILRRGRGQRLFQLDLHNLIGSVVLGWAFIVTLTGVLLGLGSAAVGLWQLTELAELQRQYPVAARATEQAPDIDRVFAEAKAAAGGWLPTTVLFPGSEYSTQRHYLVLLKGPQHVDERLLQLALVDAEGHEPVELLQLPLYLKAILLSQPLHFGDYGGLALRLLWAACTLALLFITLNGAWLWWARRRKAR